MKSNFIYLLLGLVLCLCSCGEKGNEQQFEPPTKLIVDEEMHFSLRVPEDWNIKKYNSKMDFLTYSIDGPSNHIFLYVGNFPQSHIYLSPDSKSLNEGEVVSVGTRDDFDFGGESDTLYKVHMMAIRNRPPAVIPFTYFEFSYNPKNSNEVDCEKVIESLQSVKDIPADARRVIDVFDFGVRNRFAMKDLLCDGCSLQDSLDEKSNRYVFFECEIERKSYRFVSDSSVKWDSLVTIEMDQKYDSSLKTCKSIIRLANRVGVGVPLSDYEKLTFIPFEKNDNHWIWNREQKFKCSIGGCHPAKYECFRDSCFQKTYTERSDLYFLNDTLSKVIYTWQELL
ncbi:MAG: hypothetical protein IK012_03595 [Fibrobacter sp.]|uniref:hypothetical protein n=1 Tax=Fibrobacter sp. TaxID=35828 RepID=UPI0025C55120|nr:hypothetical protein [Fibrobacter sp.]MBR4784321.1 hypothetical protein [Fibrobacter sp.]